ncbi:MAG: hypothetical protein MK102_07800 [Fuerstiella sp.]|nr:hypothetical protein [Fuerstiella sp.]
MNDERSSNVPLVLMFCLTGMCVVVGLLFFIIEPAGGHGTAHARFPDTMNQGSTGFDRLGDVRWIGLAFALLQAAFFVVVLFLGTKERTALRGWFAAVGFLYLLTLTALVIAEAAYAQGSVRDIVLGFPLPTAIMVYGVGGTPILFSMFYLLMFDRWILKPEDLQLIQELAQQGNQATTGNSD